MKMPKEARELADYLDRPLTCGWEGALRPLKAVSIRKDAIEDLFAYVKNWAFSTPTDLRPCYL